MIFRQMLGPVPLMCRTSATKDVELLVLHHEVAIFGRVNPRPRLDRADRAVADRSRRVVQLLATKIADCRLLQRMDRPVPPRTPQTLDDIISRITTGDDVDLSSGWLRPMRGTSTRILPMPKGLELTSRTGDCRRRSAAAFGSGRIRLWASGNVRHRRVLRRALGVAGFPSHVIYRHPIGVVEEVKPGLPRAPL